VTAAVLVLLEAAVLVALALAEAELVELVELALEPDELLPHPARARAPIRSASAEREPGRMGPQP
jgi:hypothetical protein